MIVIRCFLSAFLATALVTVSAHAVAAKPKQEPTPVTAEGLVKGMVIDSVGPCENEYHETYLCIIAHRAGRPSQQIMFVYDANGIVAAFDATTGQSRVWLPAGTTR